MKALLLLGVVGLSAGCGPASRDDGMAGGPPETADGGGGATVVAPGGGGGGAGGTGGSSDGAGGGGTDSDGPAVPITPTVTFDWTDQEGPEYTAPGGGELVLHHLGEHDERVLTPAEEPEIAGASDGFALEVTTRAPDPGDSKAEREDKCRAELKVHDLPDEHSGIGNHYQRLGVDYVYALRMKVASDWDHHDYDLAAASFKDTGTSLLELKQDYFPSNDAEKRNRDATFRIRTANQQCTIVVNGHEAYGADYNEVVGGVKMTRERTVVDCATLFDGDWHVITVAARWSGDPDGYIRVYFDDHEVWNRGVADDGTVVGAVTAFQDDPDLGPYFKFGQYNAFWKQGDAQGAQAHRHFVDWVVLGTPAP